jgi:hypothetical protein
MWQPTQNGLIPTQKRKPPQLTNMKYIIFELHIIIEERILLHIQRLAVMIHNVLQNRPEKDSSLNL